MLICQNAKATQLNADKTKISKQTLSSQLTSGILGKNSSNTIDTEKHSLLIRVVIKTVKKQKEKLLRKRAVK